MSKTTAHNLVHAWADALTARNVDAALALYAEDALLLPTFSPHFLQTVAQRRKYFEQLTSRENLNVMVHDKTLRVQLMSSSLAVASGIYRFQFDIDGEPLTFEARFTKTYDLSAPAPIIHHHSSQIPRTLS